MTYLGHACIDAAKRRGGAPALFCEDRQFSFDEIGAEVAGTAAALAQHGVRPGDRVAAGLPNSPELVITALAVIQAGSVLVPLNPAYTADELTYILSDSRAGVAVVTPEHAEALAAARLPNLSVIPERIAPLAGSAPVSGVTDPEAPALIVYTSGTTGQPKGAVLSHRALLTNLTAVAQAWRWTEHDRLLLTLPCFHVHGLGLGIFGSFLAGSSVVLRRRFNAEDVLGDIERSAATMFFGVPTMYNRLVALPEAAFAARNLRGMRLWVSGSAPLSVATFERFRERCGAEILERYGMTEALFVLSVPYEGPRRPGVVGIPFPGVSVRLIDPDAADRGDVVDVAAGTQGEIAIRGPNLFSGYWQRPEDTQRAFLEDYFRSGDLAVRDPDGMIRILGRSSVDIIKTRGFKVSAVEIENCLQHHPHVQEVAVVGMPDTDQGERIIAAVTPRAGAATTADAIRSYARQHLAPHKVPAEIVFIAEIPRTGPGKFKKKELIRRLASARPSNSRAV